ncbi:hypothetical protein DY218_09780 [Streptomyces triticagri]|uniref:DUF1700 domain-containing protein n=1 Tax=Streptomyces triticagri TaxID=2293568 RepID=A0A372M7Y2_9ACTN|nr:hypothetical protein [Streptomyces triticagri]RFU86959.1 hypothetical protein DY218_09780 [Streptomyces triticagri]
MKTDNSLVQDYLAAVEREASALSPAARQELLADLGEHIEVALAERPGRTREIIEEMGDPRTIAATALQELGTAGAMPAPGADGRRRRSPAWLPVVLLGVSGVLPSVVAGLLSDVGNSLLSLVMVGMAIAGVVIVCRSRHWTVAQKWTGLTLAVIIPVVVRLWWNFDVVRVGTDGDATRAVSDGARWAVVTATALCALAGVGRLWQVRDRSAE